LYRVLRPGGSLVVNVENKWALRCLIDPSLNPLWQNIRRWCRGAVGPSHFSPWHFDRTITTAGFDKRSGRSVGYGPFTLFGLPLLADHASVRLHHKLQFLADSGNPGLGCGAESYLVLARKPMGPS
jgi:hypothetical protein